MTHYDDPQTPDPALQEKLRRILDDVPLEQVSRRLRIAREALLRYMANLPQTTSVFRGIEASLRGIDVDTPHQWDRQARGR